MLLTLRHTAIAVLSVLALVATTTMPAEATETEVTAQVTQTEVATVPAPAGSSASQAEQAIDKVLRDNPKLQRVAGQPAVIGETNQGELTVALAAQAVPVSDREDLEGGEDLDARVTVVAKGVPKGDQLPTGRHESVNSSNDTTTVVESLESGFRILSVLENEKSSKQFSYEVYRGDRQLSFLTTEAGEIHVGTGDSREYSSFGVVEAPWAFDASGSAVKTTYEISADGKTLTQYVSPDAEAAYPIVADPAWTFWAGEIHCSWGSCTFYLERAKTYWLRDQVNSVGVAAGVAVLTASFCGWVAAAFTVAGYAVRLICVGAMAGLYQSIKNHLNGTYRCLTFKKYHVLPAVTIGHVSGSNSRCYYNV